ncbi:MAG: PAS domain-containing protein [archaeon]|nr:PAS domain-containing protein [archaeon]
MSNNSEIIKKKAAKVKSLQEILNLKNNIAKKTKILSLYLIVSLFSVGIASIAILTIINTNFGMTIDRDIETADLSMESTINIISSRDAMAEYATLTSSADRASVILEFNGFMNIIDEIITGFGQLDLTTEIDTEVSSLTSKKVEYVASCALYVQYNNWELANVSLQDVQMTIVDTSSDSIKNELDNLITNSSLLTNITLVYAVFNMSKSHIEMMDFGAEMLAFNETALEDEYLASKVAFESNYAILLANGSYSTEATQINVDKLSFCTASESMIDARTDELTAWSNRLAEMENLDEISSEMEEILEDVEILALTRVAESRISSTTLLYAAYSILIAGCITIAVLLLLSYRANSMGLNILSEDFSLSADKSADLIEHSKNITENLPVGLMEVDDNFNVIDINNQFVEITGWNEEEILGKKCHEFFKTNKCGTKDCFVRKAMDIKGVTEAEDIELKLESGARKYIRIIANPIIDNKGRIIGGIESFQDVSTAKKVAKQVEGISGMVLQNSNESLMSVEQINSAAQEISITAQQVSMGAQTQSEKLQEIVESVQNMAERAVKATQEADGLVNSSNDTSNLASDGEKEAQNAVEKIDNILNAAMESLAVMESLGEKSKQIGQIVDLITGIADRTNLLALNASIEAARAGEYGRGFAVVADEVGNLAENSKKAAQEISDLIFKIQTEVDKSVDGAKLSSRLAAEGKGVVSKTSSVLNQIIAAIERTNTGINSISQTLIGQNNNINNSLMDLNEISSISEEASASSEELSSSAEEMSASMEELNANSQELSATADVLTKVVKDIK